MLLYIHKIWTIPHAVLSQTHNPGEYIVKIGHLPFGFYVPYLSQQPINISEKRIDIQDQPIFTLAIVGLGHTHNWVVCKILGIRVGTDIGLVAVAEMNILKKVGVLPTDACSELIVGGEHAVSLLHKMDCLFV